jgi:hypothetical protein
MIKTRIRRAGSLLLLASALAPGGGSTAWENHSWADFIKGRFEGIALTRDGRLTLAPKLDSLADTGEAAVWAVAASPGGVLYLATGHRGRLFRVAGGKAETLWAAPQPEIFALTTGRDGAVYAGTSPDGRVWRIAEGRAEEYFNPQARYIWSLAFGKDGALYAATGDQGRIWRITAKAQGEVWYETGQSNVTSLAVARDGTLLAGTDPNGILYRITAKDRGFVLYDAVLQEIRSIVEAPDGTLYVAALGSAAAQKQAQQAASSAAGFLQTPAVTTTITITADASKTQGGLDVKPKPEAPKPATGAEGVPQTPAAPVADIPGVDKTAILLVKPDNMVETLWSSKDENIFDLSLRGQDIYFSTDRQGRIYRLTPDLKAALLVETREAEATRLAGSGDDLLAVTSNLGKAFRLDSATSTSGAYESPVHDAGNTARWGRLEWRGETNGGKVLLKTRSGNSQRPDKTWSDWQPADGAIQSPNARYIQYRVEIAGSGRSTPSVDAVVVNYQPQNTRPTVRSLQVMPQWGAVAARSTAASAMQSFSVTVTDTGDPAAATSAGTPTQTVNRTGVQQLLLSWQADDPESDKLIYTVWFRGAGEREWKVLKADIAENTLLQEADVFADGYYHFRVVASDRLVNSAANARESELVSPPVMIDQTPPSVVATTPVRSAAEASFEITATDASSAVRRAEYSLDGGAWRPLDAADGVADSLTEKFQVRIAGLSAGEHMVTVRAYDAAGNAGLRKIVLR